MYTVEGLENGIVRAEHNITVLRAAIQKEEATIHEYRQMIRAIRKAAEKPVVQVEVELVEDDEGGDGSQE